MEVAPRGQNYITDELCKATMAGLTRQSGEDGRVRFTRGSDDVAIAPFREDKDDPVEIKEVTFDQENYRSQLEWARQDDGTARLTLPRGQGPRKSSCARKNDQHGRG